MDYRAQLIETIPLRVRPTTDEPEDQLYKAHQHTKAHDLCNECLAKKEYLSAYTIAFSLLEDRLRAMAIVKQRDLLKGEDYHVFITQGIARVISFAYDKTPENSVLIQNLKNVAINRNKLLHEAMWRTDAITPTDVMHLMKLKDIVKNDVEKLKRLVRRNKKLDAA
jgi:hypothetical protein